MTVSSGFFNSLNGDRKYDADAFNQFFDGIITDGVFSTVGGSFLVEPTTGMGVSVSSGRAWFMRSWIDNNAPTSFILSNASPGLDRYDVIVLDIDKRDITRKNDILVIEGIASSTPTVPVLANDSDHKQYPLAVILIPAATVQITAGNIENKVGTNDCPFATGLMQQISVSDLLQQWDWEFYEWFVNLQNELDSNQVTNLQAQIDELEDYPDGVGRNLIINGDMSHSSHPVPYIVGPGIFEDYVGLSPDRWYPSLRDGDLECLVSQIMEAEGGEDEYWYKYYVNSPHIGLNLDSNAYVFLKQAIEERKLSELKKGSGGARPLVLTFKFRSNITGQFNVRIVDVVNSRHYVDTFQNSNPGFNTLVELMIPPDFIGSFNDLGTDTGLRLEFILNVGSDYRAASLPGTWDDSANTNYLGDGMPTAFGTSGADYFQVTKVQLEVGYRASTFERLSKADNIRQCSRYFQVIDRYDTVIKRTGHAGDPVHSGMYGLRFTHPVRIGGVFMSFNFYYKSDTGTWWSFGDRTIDLNGPYDYDVYTPGDTISDVAAHLCPGHVTGYYNAEIM